MMTTEKMMQLKPLLENEDFVQELTEAETAEAQCKVFADHGVSVDEAELTEIANAISAALPEEKDELSEDDLENVAGGFVTIGVVVAGVVVLISSIALWILWQKFKKGLISAGALKKAAKSK